MYQHLEQSLILICSRLSKESDVQTVLSFLFCIFAPHSPALFITLRPQIDEMLVFDPYFPIVLTVPLR